MVAQSRVSDRDGPIRIVASGKRAVSALGLLPRSATGTASSSATGGAQTQLGASRQLLDSALMDRDHGSHQSGMDLLPLQLSAPGATDVGGCAVTGELSFALSEWQPISPGGGPSEIGRAAC